MRHEDYRASAHQEPRKFETSPLNCPASLSRLGVGRGGRHQRDFTTRARMCETHETLYVQERAKTSKQFRDSHSNAQDSAETPSTPGPGRKGGSSSADTLSMLDTEIWRLGRCAHPGASLETILRPSVPPEAESRGSLLRVPCVRVRVSTGVPPSIDIAGASVEQF